MRFVRLLPRPIRYLASIVTNLFRIPLSSAATALNDLSRTLPRLETAKSVLGHYSGLPGEHHFELLKEGSFSEPHFENLIKHALSPEDNVLDVGANIGTHTILMAHTVPNGRVYAFEPQSITHAILQSNVLLNQAENVTTYPFAVSDQTGEIVAIHLPAARNFNSGIASVSTSGNLGDKTLTYRLDDLSLPPVQFLKLDVQGSELRALQGGTALIKRDRPLMIVEIEEQYLRAFGTSSQEVMELLLGWNYTLYRIENAYPCDHICIPKEKVTAFEQSVLTKLDFNTRKIAGQRVSLSFNKSSDQTYSSVQVFE